MDNSYKVYILWKTNAWLVIQSEIQIRNYDILFRKEKPISKPHHVYLIL